MIEVNSKYLKISNQWAVDKTFLGTPKLKQYLNNCTPSGAIDATYPRNPFVQGIATHGEPTDLGCCWLSGTAMRAEQVGLRLIPILKLRLEQTKQMQHRQARDTYWRAQIQLQIQIRIRITRYRYTRERRQINYFSWLFYFFCVLLFFSSFIFVFFTQLSETKTSSNWLLFGLIKSCSKAPDCSTDSDSEWNWIASNRIGSDRIGRDALQCDAMRGSVLRCVVLCCVVAFYLLFMLRSLKWHYNVFEMKINTLESGPEWRPRQHEAATLATTRSAAPQVHHRRQSDLATCYTLNHIGIVPTELPD